MQRIHNELPGLGELSADNARKCGRAVAFKDREESVTWGEFDERSNRVANLFDDYVSKGDRIAFYCEPSVRHAVYFNGALKSGAVTTNLAKRIAPKPFQYCLRQTKPSVVVLDAEFADDFAEVVSDETLKGISAVFTIGESTRDFARPIEEDLAERPPEAPDVLLEEDDIVTIGWTSGSTGRPKGWCHTNRTMFLKGQELATRSGFTRSDMQLVVNRPSFLIWTSFFTRSLLGCEATYYMRDWDAKRWLEVIEREPITQTVLVPTMWREVLDSEPESYDLRSLRSIMSTGEKLNPDTLRRLREKICENISQSYGSTEIHSTVLYNDELTEERIESVGKPQSGTRVRIVEPDGDVDDELPPNELGEIVVKSYQCPVWAWNDHATTKASFEDGWWRSGDLGYVDEAGFLYIEGRVDFQIKSKGVKIVPGPIEEALENHPEITNAVVVGVDDDEYGERVTAIVESSSESVTVETLEEWVERSDLVADHERPRAYYFVDQIERTPSGKLDRLETKASLDLP